MKQFRKSISLSSLNLDKRFLLKIEKEILEIWKELENEIIEKFEKGN